MAFLVSALPPCVLFEDDHLLVVNKPAGFNTHAPSPYAGEGLYDWLRCRESRWASLAIVQRLDKETSGVLVFSKTALANRSLTEQFTRSAVQKRYLLKTDRAVPEKPFTVASNLIRIRSKYASARAGGDRAVTRFECVSTEEPLLVRAEPLTGKTHQIRVHASESGFPILGDALYGGTSAARLFLHAEELSFRHPATGRSVSFRAQALFEQDRSLALRAAIIDPAETDAFRLIHGASDGWPGWTVDLLKGILLSESEEAQLDGPRLAQIEPLRAHFGAAAAYHKHSLPKPQLAERAMTAPKKVVGENVPSEFEVRENGARFRIRLEEGLSYGIFLDQRDNRRRLMTSYISPEFLISGGAAERFEVLNTFAYTCAFSVCAAMAGARVTSVDLSKKHLDWGRKNFAANSLDCAGHNFIAGDVFEWLRQLGRRGRVFDVVILDPPTFSRSKASGVFRAEKDYPKLIALALAVLGRGGTLLACTNAARLEPEPFVRMVEDSIRESGRDVIQKKYFPQPPDFPISKEEPGHLKSVWVKVG